MRRRALAAFGLALALGCDKPAQFPAAAAAPQPTVAAPPNADERENLLNIAYGASVISRTAEITLEASALRAIDGDSLSAWTSPPGDFQQTMVFALPARSRIEKVGVRMPADPNMRVKRASFETSVDGVTFRPLLEQAFNEFAEIQLFPVPPTEAVYVRVNVLEAPGRFASFQSVQVRGLLLDRPVAPPLDGCWTVNGLPARFATAGGSVRGAIGSGAPVLIEGGADGPLYRVAWIKKGDWGFAAITVSPEGKHLSGGKWYQEPIPYDFGESWFGERSGCATNVPDSTLIIARRFLDRLHRFPLYGLHFDATGRLSEPDSVTALELIANLSAQRSSHPFRLVSHEYRGASAEDNRRRAQARLDSLQAVLQKRGVDLARFEFVAAGSERPPQRIENETMRVLYSVVDIDASVEGR
jgi:hypothetical protein